MDIISLKKAFDSSIYNKEAYVIRGLFNHTPSWDPFIEALNYNYSNVKDEFIWNDKLIKKDGYSTNILIYNELDPVVFNVPPKIFPEIYKMFMMFSEVLGEELSVKAIMNFVGSESSYWIHKDNHHVISWNCIGKIEWRIYKDLEDSELNSLELPNRHYESYVLNPGDVLFCPKGVAHQVVSSEPRASLIFQGSKESLI
jgi:hypothetical protein